jgi:hypothetical protein
MPGGDGTGPMREGPMTGGGFGPCGAGHGRGTDLGRGQGRGAGFGGGQGRRNRRSAPEWSGWRRTGVWGRPGAPWSPETEQDELRRDEAALETELQLIKARITELDQS